jgi:hypothetical protein
MIAEPMNFGILRLIGAPSKLKSPSAIRRA